MAQIHIDEKAGSDISGDGSIEKPYETLAFAIYSHQASSPQYFIRVVKNSEITYEEPTQTSMKKAKKNAEGIEKKRKKAEELAARDAQAITAMKERKEKHLEESKKMILKEDDSLPKATRVCYCVSFCPSQLTLSRGIG